MKTTSENSIWKNIFSRGESANGTTESLLSHVPAFGELSPRELKEVAAIVHRREYQAGEYVFFQNDPGLGMYIIRSGEVSIRISETDGEQKELAILKEGDFFGELALLDESPRSAAAVCRTNCSLIGFFRPDLFALIEKQTDLGVKIVLKLAEILAERLRKTDVELSKVKSRLDLLAQQHANTRRSKKEAGHGKSKTISQKKNPSL